MEGPSLSLVSGNLNGSMTSLTSRRKEQVVIVEQPAPKALRFRYECEGRSAGSIPGSSSTPDNKTYPTIRVVGHEGRAVVVVSCVTKDEPYRPHPHNLVGRDGCKKGVCTLEIPPDTMSVAFPNLGIQCVKKKDIEASLKTREEIRVDPYRTGFSHKNHPTSIDLNALRLCFQVFLEGEKNGKFTIPLPPIVTDPIYDKKASADLVIVKLSDCNSYVDGGRKDIIMLCEKVAKEDIQIRFFEERDGIVVWEGFGDFLPNHVHKQTAIWFKTPKYRTLEVTEPVKAFVQLKRPSDGATSEPLPFEFLPLDAGRPCYWSMKKRNYNLFSSILDNQTGLTKALQAVQEIPTMEIEETPLKIVEEQNDNANNDNNNNNNTITENEDENSLNQLIDEVAELDELYSKNNFQMDENENNLNNFNDAKTYTSLQLAFKNPMNIEFLKPDDVVVEEVNGNKRDSPVEKLPPLPPKRQKRTDADEETKRKLKEALLHPKPKISRSHSFNTPKKLDESKYLGSTSTLPNPKKRGFLSRLFGRKKNGTASMASRINVSTEPSPPPPPPISRDSTLSLPVIEADLTEAEHYALYTAMAPHATESEFDEMSCYYAAVEGGKILS